MAAPRVTIAQLDEERLAKVHALENELGVLLVAYDQEPQLADLTEEQLGRLQAVEKEIGVYLLAFDRS